MIDASDARHLDECVAKGGVAVFPTDTVYGVCCDPENGEAVKRLYALKGRPAARRAAVMFFDRELALAALPDLADSERAALELLLPGPVTLLLPNPERRFPLASQPTSDGRDSIGLRVPLLNKRIEALGVVRRPLMQSSANLTGGADARCLFDVPLTLREGADIVIDGGDLPGTPSTVIDLCDYRQNGEWRVVREGAIKRSALERLLA